jgi:uncharacterized protein (DUF2147 family)
MKRRLTAWVTGLGCRRPARHAARLGGTRIAAAIVAAALSISAAAMSAETIPAAGSAARSPLGLWRIIDEETNRPKALIRITEINGMLSGRIEKLLSDKPDSVCEKCRGELKNKPVLGMIILTGMRKGEDGYDGGTILDPSKGEIYKCRLELEEGGATLKVRGYAGIALFGRTQIWHRELP